MLNLNHHNQEHASQRNAWIKKSKDLINEVNHALHKAAHASTVDTCVPNLEEEAHMLEWAGISFGEEFTYKLSKSLKVSNRSFQISVIATRDYEWSQLPPILRQSPRNKCRLLGCLWYPNPC